MKEISEFDLGIEEECIPNQSVFTQNCLQGKKHDGSKQVIINLKNLTAHIEKHYCKMETVKDVILMMFLYAHLLPSISNMHFCQTLWK